MKYYLLLFIFAIQFHVFAQQDIKTDTLQQIFQSLSAAQTNHDDLKVINEANRLGDFYFSRDDTTNALQYYETAFATAKKIKHPALMGESLNNMGAIFQHKADYKNAINSYSRAAEMFTKAGNDALLANSLNNLGKATALTRNYKKSYKIFETANSKARKSNNQQAIVDSYAGIASALQKMGSRKYAAHYQALYETEKQKLEQPIQPNSAVAQSGAKTKDAVNGAATVTTSAASQKMLPQQNSMTSTTEIAPTAILFFGTILLVTIGLIALWFKRGLRALKAEMDTELAKRDALQHDRFHTLLGIRDDLQSDMALIHSINSSLSNSKSLEELREKCEMVGFVSQKMNDNISDMAWAIDTHHITVATLLTDLQEYTANYFAVQPVRLVFDFPENSPQIQITKESYRALFLAVKETFHNITHHSGATEVIVKAGVSDDYFTVSIMDNGEVFDLAFSKTDKIANMVARFEKIGGKFTLFSKPSHGSHTTVGLPLRKVVNGM